MTSTELMLHGVGRGVVVTANTELNVSGHPLPTGTIVIFRRPSLLIVFRTKLNIFVISVVRLDTKRWLSWLGECCKSAMVAGSIPGGVIGIIH